MKMHQQNIKLVEYAKAAAIAKELRDSGIAEFYQLLGLAIKKRRTELGLRQEDIGNRVGLSRTSVTNIEKGKQRILAHDIYIFAAALETSARELMPE